MSSNYEIVNGVYKGPEHFVGFLNLSNTQITSLGALKSVGGFLYLENTPIKDLGYFESVSGNLYLSNTPITSLGSLKRVGGFLNLYNTPISSLGCLETVGHNIYFSDYEYYTWDEYQELISVFERDTDPMDYPLYINDKRTPIRLFVLESFKKEN